MKAPVDLAEIRRNIRGNAEQIRNLVSIFRQTGSKSLADAHAAFAVKDAAQLAQIGHRCKSSSRYMGAHDFADFMLDLETSAKQGDWARIEATLARLDAEWGRVEAELSGTADY